MKGQMKVGSAFHNKYPFSQYYPGFFKFSDYLLLYEQERLTSLDTKARSHAPRSAQHLFVSPGIAASRSLSLKISGRMPAHSPTRPFIRQRTSQWERTSTLPLPPIPPTPSKLLGIVSGNLAYTFGSLEGGIPVPA